MSFFNTISKNDVVFLTPLIVATAPLSLLYIANATPRNTTGHGKGEVDVRFATVAVFSTPPSLRATSPIANATPRNTTGHGKGEV